MLFFVADTPAADGITGDFLYRAKKIVEMDARGLQGNYVTPFNELVIKLLSPKNSCFGHFKKWFSGNPLVLTGSRVYLNVSGKHKTTPCT